jgi:hypothetical protein
MSKFNDIVHEGISVLSKHLRSSGLSTENCMIVVRANREFFVAATGISAMNYDSAVEDFSRMIRASFDDDEKAKSFLLNILIDISKREKNDCQNN